MRFIFPLVLLLTACAPGQDNSSWQKRAEYMVKSQIEARDVSDQRVLLSMMKTPRHLFVPEPFRPLAYEDSALPIGERQTISQPYIVGLMTEQLNLTGKEKVLEIGTGSGYQAAILSQLTTEVFSIELIQVLADSSSQRLKDLGYDNVKVRWGDGYQGWPEQAPFDRIIVTAAPPEIPEKLLEQLAPGGIMVLPVGDHYQELKRLEKSEDGRIESETIIPVRFVPMVHPDSIED